MKKIITLSIFILISLSVCVILVKNSTSQKENGSVTQKFENIPTIKGLKYVEEKSEKQHESRVENLNSVIEQANVPIEFWGKVVDHSGVSLEGVKISYRVEQPRRLWSSNTVVKNISTDKNGAFYIKDNGSGFSIVSFAKEGYRKTKGQIASFTYSDGSKHVPDVSKFEIFTLIKQDQMQGLIKSSKQLLLDWDGKPIYYDLKTGRFGQSGEIKITALRGEIEGEGRQARYDWSFKVEAPNGGVMETTREAAYLAPEKGYRSIWKYGFLSSNPKWQSRKQGDTFLFFKLANDDFGLLKINYSTRTGKSRVSGGITSYLNPSGGRILEYDGRFKIKQ